MKATNNQVPRHLGIIMDGNRRFSKRLLMKPHLGHEWGARKTEDVLNWCKEYGIKELTLYAFSIENFDRPKREFDYLMNLFRKEYNALKDDPKIKDVKINFIGRLWKFPNDIQKTMYDLMDETKNHKKYIINIAMAYGGRAEVIDAVKRLAEDVKKGKININKINEENFKNYLYLDSEPDLIIRTSESRLSGFLLYQSAYSEIIFLPKVFWPDLKKKDFVKCLNDYSKRQRRFGR